MDAPESKIAPVSIISFEGHTPSLHPTVFVADGAHIIGDVQIGADASVWFNTVLRGDINSIIIGDRTNIQDGSVFHVTHEQRVTMGSDVTVGHRAIVHACTVGDCCLIGMGSVILDNATVGSYSLVAAGAVVLQNFVVPEGSLVAGVPARVIRPLTDQEKEQLRQSAVGYVGYARRFKK